jgi:hypothetical protein
VPSNVDNSKVIVEMPFIVFALLNRISAFCVCSIDIVDPTNDSWRLAEQLALSSLQVYLKYYATYGISNVRFDQLRPKALYTPTTAALQISVPQLSALETEVTLIEHRLCKDHPRIDIAKLPLERVTPKDLSTGGLIHGCVDQCDWDTLTVVGDSVIISQVKDKKLINEQTGVPPTSSKLKTSLINSGQEIQERARVVDKENVIVEFVSPRPLENKGLVPRDGICVVHQDNWSAVMGPMFGHIKPKLQNATLEVVR